MYKVLIAEDDPMVAMINEQYVKRNPDYLIAGKVRDGQSALDFLQAQQVDLVILESSCRFWTVWRSSRPSARRIFP